MAPSRARRRRAKKRQWLSAVFLLVAVVLVASLLTARVYLQRNRVVLDEDLCPTTGVTGYTAILIDGTDSFNPIQRADIRRRLDLLRDASTAQGIQQGEQVTIYAPRQLDSENLLSPSLRVCNPGDASNASGLVENPRQIQQRYEQGFAEQLEEALQVGLDAEGADESPIMEMIQAVAISAFGAGNPDVRRRLIIVSDMLHNTQSYSHYSDSLDFESVSDRAFFAHLITDLQNAEVTILYVTRPGTEGIQTRRHVQFWEDYMFFMNGQLESVSRIGG